MNTPIQTLEGQVFLFELFESTTLVYCWTNKLFGTRDPFGPTTWTHVQLIDFLFKEYLQCLAGIAEYCGADIRYRSVGEMEDIQVCRPTHLQSIIPRTLSAVPNGRFAVQYQVEGDIEQIEGPCAMNRGCLFPGDMEIMICDICMLKYHAKCIRTMRTDSDSPLNNCGCTNLDRCVRHL